MFCQKLILSLSFIKLPSRKTLEDEVNQLLEDITFLQNCLDSQADVRDCVTPRNLSREPTLTGIVNRIHKYILLHLAQKQ